MSIASVHNPAKSSFSASKSLSFIRGLHSKVGVGVVVVDVVVVVVVVVVVSGKAGSLKSRQSSTPFLKFITRKMTMNRFLSVKNHDPDR